MGFFSQRLSQTRRMRAGRSVSYFAVAGMHQRFFSNWNGVRRIGWRYPYRIAVIRVNYGISVVVDLKPWTTLRYLPRHDWRR